MKSTNYPEGTTHVLTMTYPNSVVEYYKRIGTSKYGNPTYVRFIKSKNAWAKTPQAFDCVKNDGVEVTS